jgi:hypothetical protein
MRNGIGPHKLGVPKGVGKMYGAKSVAKKADIKSNKEKAAMVAEKRAAGKDSDSLRRGMKAEEFKKAGGAKISQGQPGFKEAVSMAEAATEKRMRRVNPNSMAKTPAKQVNKKQVARTNKRIDRDEALADRNPERALSRAEKLKNKAANMPSAKPGTRRNERLSDKRQERLVRAANIEYSFAPNSKNKKK